jgi:hypothetical protein
VTKSDASLARRVADLEQRLRAAEADIRIPRQSPPTWAAPRERWLGRIAASPTPTAGDNVYAVELLSVAYDDSAPGDKAKVLHERGERVYALAWPRADYAAGDFVTAERLRGSLSGDSYAGEWFIPLAKGGGDRCVILGDIDGASTASQLWNQYVGAQGDNRIVNGYGTWAFPNMTGELSNSAGTVYLVKSPSGANNGTPAAYTDNWLELTGRYGYSLHVITTWYLGSLDAYDAATHLQDNTLHNHGGAAALSGAQRLYTYKAGLITEATISYNGGSVVRKLGTSDLPYYYGNRSDAMFACHSGIVRPPKTTSSSEPVRVRLSLRKNSSYGVGSFPASLVFYLESLQVRVTQDTDS